MSAVTISLYVVRGVGAALAVWLTYSYTRLPSPKTLAIPGAGALSWRPATPRIDADKEPFWSAFRGHHRVAPATGGALSQRFRLAGTFLISSGNASSSIAEIRKAIIDDLQTGQQHLVNEGDVIDIATVVSIVQDQATLRDAQGEETLWLKFLSPVSAGEAAPVAAAAELVGPARFGGRQIAEFRWQFSRQALIDYYQELRDDPERMVQVFDSMEPYRDETGRIQGYQLNVQGEEAFFDAVGLKPGDVVRSVNSLRMSSRQRAEFLLKEFIMDRSNAFILEVERGGESHNFVYQMR